MRKQLSKPLADKLTKAAFTLCIAITVAGMVVAGLWFVLPSPARIVALVIGAILVAVGASSYCGMAKLAPPP